MWLKTIWFIKPSPLLLNLIQTHVKIQPILTQGGYIVLPAKSYFWTSVNVFTWKFIDEEFTETLTFIIFWFSFLGEFQSPKHYHSKRWRAAIRQPKKYRYRILTPTTKSSVFELENRNSSLNVCKNNFQQFLLLKLFIKFF